jgi:hypothetical protein
MEQRDNSENRGWQGQQARNPKPNDSAPGRYKDMRNRSGEKVQSSVSATKQAENQTWMQRKKAEMPQEQKTKEPDNNQYIPQQAIGPGGVGARTGRGRRTSSPVEPPPPEPPIVPHTNTITNNSPVDPSQIGRYQVSTCTSGDLTTITVIDTATGQVKVKLFYLDSAGNIIEDDIAWNPFAEK